jgi:hypothetical protein
LALKLAQAALGRFEVLLGLITLGFDAGELLAQVTVVLAALLGFGFPLVAAVFDLGKLTHRLRSLTSPHGDRAWQGEVELARSREDRAMSGAVHLVSALAP